MRSSFVLVALVGLIGVVAGQTLKPNLLKVAEMRNQLMYPYPKEHYKPEIINGSPQLHLQFTFYVPFFGIRFNYTWVSLFGVMQFSKEEDSQSYPLKFPNDEWPYKRDPAFIGPFFAHALIGRGDNAEAEAQRPPGVYFKAYENIGASKKQEEIDLQEAVRLDVQQGIIGATDFRPKHIITVTWKNITFGGSANPRRTNTYQSMVTTDGQRTYAIFNYQNITWTSATIANGDKEQGTGGTAAYVGFNAGNGTRAFEYHPYSQTNRVIDLVKAGGTNGHHGRHIFRIDETIQQGACMKETDFPLNGSPKLFISPESGHMLGGTIVNITGPCFNKDEQIRIKFHDKTVTCVYQEKNRATCITPPIYVAGYIRVANIEPETFPTFTNRFYIENPLLYKERVWIEDPRQFNSLDLKSFNLFWNASSLHPLASQSVQIGLWGYRESVKGPQLEFIRLLKKGVNSGKTEINMADFDGVDDGNKRNYTVGLIQVNVTLGGDKSRMPVVWSRPIPLGWYFSKQWTKQLGSKWAQAKCKAWVQEDNLRTKFEARLLPACPCTLKQAQHDKGRFIPDASCDGLETRNCYGKATLQCVISAQPTVNGTGQQCCYNTEGDLLTPVTTNAVFSFPSRAHPFGAYPYDDPGYVPGLSHWYQDVMGYYSCCEWNKDTDNCTQFRKLRPTNDCVGYTTSNVSQVYGDPHFITFDGLNYTFNGKGEFSLVHVNSTKYNLDVQARFEQYVDVSKALKRPATQLTAVVVQDNTSSSVQIHRRPTTVSGYNPFKLDVLVDGQQIFFDAPEKRIQNFRGVTVHVPIGVVDQSTVVVSLHSGAGVEVINKYGYLAARVYLPQSFKKQTLGLMGNWSDSTKDDLVTPTGAIVNAGDDAQKLHTEFGLQWMVSTSSDKPRLSSIFHYENSRTSSFYNDRNFRPIFGSHPPIPPTADFDERAVLHMCHDNLACRYDFIVTEDRDAAKSTVFFTDDVTKLRSATNILMCPAFKPQPNMRMSTTNRRIGTSVSFECSSGYVLQGAPKRSCVPPGRWSPMEQEQPSICVKSSNAI